ncbi:hypothetical protein [Bradyrhizobium sp. BR 1432]|uniref:hypothetical protein n=1 Tax=Bradyrhizobium sp. BR 1432 TaxID=3447966 RepID=UPI003EE65E7B
MIHLSRTPIPTKRSRRIKGPFVKGIAYFSRSPDSGRMNAEDKRMDEAEGLRLVRAFLSLPPDKRAEVIAFVEELARAHGRPEKGKEISPQ